MPRLLMAALAILLLQESENELKPAATIKFNACLRDIALSKDRKWLYVLNTSDGKLQRVDTAKRTLDAAAVDLADGTEGMCLSPDGKTIYTFASPEGHKAFLEKDKVQSGKLQVIDVATMKVTNTFAIEFDPYDMEADDKGRLFITGGSGAWSSIAVVDVARKALIAKWANIETKSVLRISPDRKRLYLAGSRITSIQIPDDVTKDKAEIWDVMQQGSAVSSMSLLVAPDGKHVVSPTGSVLRVAKNRTDDLKLAGTVEAWYAAAMDEGAGVLLVATRGMIKGYSYPDLKLQQAFTVPQTPYRMVLDAASKTLYCAVEKEARNDARDTAGVGDLLIFDATKLLAATADVVKPKPPVPDPNEEKLVDETKKAAGADWKPVVKAGQPCPACAGKAKVTVDEKDEKTGAVDTFELSCVTCAGRGKVDLISCTACRGVGKTFYSKVIVADGSALTVDGFATCARCAGSCFVPHSALEQAFREGKKEMSCLLCAGAGKAQFKRTRDGVTKAVTTDCGRCAGKGKLKIVVCDTCKETGIEMKSREVVLDGHPVSVTGSAACSKCGGLGHVAAAE